METISSPPRGPSGPQREGVEQCEECAAPVERTQRYCVSCGVHRRHVPDPATRYLTASRAHSRRQAKRPGSPEPSRRPSSLTVALVLAVIPVAVAVGILVGRSSTSGDAKLIAALRAQRPQVVTTQGSGGSAVAAATTSSAPTALSSTFPLQSGWTVQLQALTAAGASQASVAAAERAARLKGAGAVGLIVAGDYRIAPTPPAGADIIYSGAYRTRAAAAQALARLSKRFPGARVIHVGSVGSASSATTSGKVLARSVYGTAHQIAGSKPTGSQLAAGRRVVQHIQQTQGKSYVNAQRGLPDQISIP